MECCLPDDDVYYRSDLRITQLVMTIISGIRARGKDLQIRRDGGQVQLRTRNGMLFEDHLNQCHTSLVPVVFRLLHQSYFLFPLFLVLLPRHIMHEILFH